MMEEKQLELAFPFNGVDVSQGPFAQRPGTSPLGVNVRGFTTDLRKRGGSRPGLNPWFGAGSTEQVEGFHLIQSLSCVVWVSPQATILGSRAIVVNFDVHYSESNNPPARDEPEVRYPVTWYEGTKPIRTFVTDPVIGTPDGGGTGRGTAKFTISTDGTLVTLVCEFISAGFPPVGPDYFYSGHGKTFTLTQLATSFFAPGGHISSSWTVIAGSFIGNYFFNVFKA